MARGFIADIRKELTAKVLGDGKDAKIEDLPEAAISRLGLGALQHAEDIPKALGYRCSRTDLHLHDHAIIAAAGDQIRLEPCQELRDVGTRVYLNAVSAPEVVLSHLLDRSGFDRPCPHGNTS